MAWSESSVQALEADIEEFMQAASERRFRDAYAIMEKRSGLILGVVLPLLVVRTSKRRLFPDVAVRRQVLRWPAATLAILRGVTPVLTFAIGVAARTITYNPRLLPLIAGLLRRLAETSWRRMAVRNWQ